MKTLALTLVILLTLITFRMDSAWSKEKGEVTLNMAAEVEVEIVNEDGQTEIQRVPAAKVIPGDVVIYTINYTNNGSEPAENFVITNPIPQHMVYLTKSAECGSVETTFSVDGGNSYDTPGNLTVVNSEGTLAPAKVSDYTHIRWVLNEPVAPHETGQVNFKARLK